MLKACQILFNGKKNILWGTGANGKKLFLSLLHYTIPVDLFCDSNPKKQGICLLNKKVISPEDLIKNKEEYNVIVTTGREDDTKSIVDFLSKNGIDNYLLWADLVSYTNINIEFSLQALYKVIRDTNNKKVIIYGTERKAFSLRKILELIDVKVDYMVDEVEDSFYNNGILIKPVYELLEEKVDEIFIVLTGDKETGKEDILKKLGFRFFEHYNYIEDYKDSNVPFLLDPHLGHNYIVHTTMDEPGVMKWGAEKESDIVIVTSGGSNTTATDYFFKSWPQLLYEKLSLNGYNVTVMNAACSSYKSSQELMKLQRDIIGYRPDIILSYTGVNDVGGRNVANEFPFVHYFQKMIMEESKKHIETLDGPFEKAYVLGVKHHLGRERQFVQNVRMMRAVCREFGVEFQGFLQPALSAKKDKLTSKETALMWHLEIAQETLERMSAFFESVKEIDNKDSLIDLTHLFDEYDNIYMDICHVTEEGNAIIADYMYDFLIEKGWLLKNLEGRKKDDGCYK